MGMSHQRSPELYAYHASVDLVAGGVIEVSSDAIGLSQVIAIGNQPVGTTLRFVGGGFPSIVYIFNIGSEDVTLQGGVGQTAVSSPLTVGGYYLKPLDGLLVKLS